MRRNRSIDLLIIIFLLGPAVLHLVNVAEGSNLTITEASSNSFISKWNTTLTSEGSSTNQKVRLPLVSDENYNFSVDGEDGTNKTLTRENQAERPKLTDTNTNSFTSRWDTSLISPGSSNSYQISLPLEPSDMYNFTVDWGDGTSNNISRWDQAEVKHTYTSEGVYTITIEGMLVGWRFNDGGDRLKIIEISQWGNIRLGNSDSYFYGSRNLQLTATDALNLTGTTTLYRAFADCRELSNNSMMNYWDVSSVTNMRLMFYYAHSFNQPIGNWDVSSTTDMSSMFSWAISFNQSIDSWDVSSVTSMGGMFYYALSFNQPIGNWDVSSVTIMGSMFSIDYYFNQPIGNWDVSSVTNMEYMFNGASLFNQPIENWNVSSVTDMEFMFSSATSFNQAIGDWDVSSVTDMVGMISYVTLSTANYDNLLAGWSAIPLQYGIDFDGGNSQYSNTTARQYIIDTFGWTIRDGGLAEGMVYENTEIIPRSTELSNMSTEIAFLPSPPVWVSLMGMIAVISVRKIRKHNKYDL